MPSLRTVVQSLLPPVLLVLWRRLRHGAPQPVWVYRPEGFPPDAGAPPWSLERIAEAEAARWPAFAAALADGRPLALSHEVEDPAQAMTWAQNHWLALLYVVGRIAARHPGRALRLLDWGSGLGHAALVLRAGLPQVALEYHAHDYPSFLRRLPALLPDAHAHVDPAAALAERYDLVLASGSLHYARDWRDQLQRLAAAAASDLYLCRLPVVEHAASYVYSQRVDGLGYASEFHSWCLNRTELLAAVAALGFLLERSFVADEIAPAAGAPEPGRYAGFWFVRRA